MLRADGSVMTDCSRYTATSSCVDRQGILNSERPPTLGTLMLSAVNHTKHPFTINIHNALALLVLFSENTSMPAL
jgi:hypothetical protein